MPRPSKRIIGAATYPAAAFDPATLAVGRRIAARGNNALQMLLDAFYYSCDLECNAWDFAVGISTLKKSGLTSNDFRWLVAKGFLHHSAETTSTGAEFREFQAEHSARFVRNSCFILSEAGINFAQTLLKDTESRRGRHTRSLSDQQHNSWAHIGVDTLPHWDSDRQELTLDGTVIKRFKVPARNQETVLTVFQEEGWPARIDDPLPQVSDINPKRRLHDTINALNRHQKQHLIQFRGDGQGEGVLWEFVASKRKAYRNFRSA